MTKGFTLVNGIISKSSCDSGLPYLKRPGKVHSSIKLIHFNWTERPDVKYLIFATGHLQSPFLWQEAAQLPPIFSGKLSIAVPFPPRRKPELFPLSKRRPV